MSEKTLKRPEVLAPAGTLEKLKVAVDYGADAVFVGGQAYGLRSRAGNFTMEELQEGINYAHAHGAKVHVAANMVTHEGNETGAGEWFRELRDLGLDAVIVSDPALIEICSTYAPGLNIHLSTQASATNVETFHFWKQYGLTRVVLAREVTMEELAEIRKRTDLEIEAFVHGAMCISYSGRCTLSNHMSDRDANRGGCSQSCRWKYDLYDMPFGQERKSIHGEVPEEYSMSAVDMCMIENIPDLIDNGVDSLKIEGRMKSVHYCATVAKVYRTAIDTYLKEGKEWYVRPEWIAELEKISHRPYTDGFAEGRPDETAQNYGKSTNTQSHDFIGLVMGYNEEEKYVDLEQRNNFKVGDKVEFCQPKGELVETVIEKMTDEDGNPIDVAPHAQMKVRIYMDTPLEPYSMMRRECKSKEA